VTESNRAVIEDIVCRLDGLPLAIELAASRLHMLSLEQLHTRLADRFKILVGEKRGRHATLVIALDWSWDLLEPWEQSAMAQASVFEGGFTLEAAEAILDLTEWPAESTVLDVIQKLVDKSWLKARVALGVPRFEMYVTLQEYASMKLKEERTADRSGLGMLCPEEVERNHGKYYAAMGSEDSIETQVRNGDVSRLEVLRLELENLVATCRRASDRADYEIAVGAYAAVWEVLEATGPMSLGVELGELVTGMKVSQASKCARTLRRYADALHHVGRVSEARRYYEETLAIHREVGNRQSEGIVLNLLASLDYEQGRIQEARRHFEEALAIHREVGNRRSEGKALGNLGALDLVQGRFAEARKRYEEALTIHREEGARGAEGSTLANLGTLHKEQDRLVEAQQYYEEALAALREAGGRRNVEGLVLINLGGLHLEQDRMQDAQRSYEEALAIHREIGNRRSEGIALGFLGYLDYKQGRMEEASRNLEQGIDILREIGDKHELGRLLCIRGELEHHEVNLTAARASLDEAESIAETLSVTSDSAIARAITRLRKKLSLP
jgi:tetratricopeptide (TPR) repeat protein